MKSLVVEDEFSTRLIMKKLLGPFGPVKVVEDGKGALKAIQKAWKVAEPFDLVCLDMLLPGMNGDEVLAEIRRMENEAGEEVSEEGRIKVIMATSIADGKTAVKEGDTPCDGYILKPIDREKLLTELERLALI